MAFAFSKKDFLATKWFTLEKIIQMIMGIFIVPKIFNVVGTIDIGKLKFVESIVGMLTPIFFLGLSAICIREIVFKPKRSYLILTTALYLRLFSWLLVFSGVLVYLYVADSDKLTWLYIIVTTSYLFKLTDLFEFYLIAKKWTKLIFINKITCLFIVVSLQYYGVVNQFNVMYFAVVLAFDFILQGVIYYIILKYTKQFKLKKWPFSFKLAKQLLSMSLPLILTHGLVMFYISIDEMFLKYFDGDHANGVFGSVQFLVIALSWNIGWAIINALYPSLAESYNTDRKLYLKKGKQLLGITTLLGLFIGVFYSVFGNYILDTYFSENYMEAKTPLKIFCWAPLFVFIGMVYEKHLIITKKLNNNVYRFMLGCILNITLLLPDSYMAHYRCSYCGFN